MNLIFLLLHLQQPSLSQKWEWDHAHPDWRVVASPSLPTLMRSETNSTCHGQMCHKKWKSSSCNHQQLKQEPKTSTFDTCRTAKNDWLDLQPQHKQLQLQPVVPHCGISRWFWTDWTLFLKSSMSGQNQTSTVTMLHNSRQLRKASSFPMWSFQKQAMSWNPFFLTFEEITPNSKEWLIHSKLLELFPNVCNLQDGHWCMLIGNGPTSRWSRTQKPPMRSKLRQNVQKEPFAWPDNTVWNVPCTQQQGTRLTHAHLQCGRKQEGSS